MQTESLLQKRARTNSVWESGFEYLNRKIPGMIHKPVQSLDQHFASTNNPAIPTPESTVRLSFYAAFVEGRQSNPQFDTDVKVDLKIPNIEKRLRMFIESSREESLPDKHASEIENDGMSLGLRQLFHKLNITSDAGVKVKLSPDAFARITWQHLARSGDWSFVPRQRIFADTKEGVGSLTSFKITKHFGPSGNGQIRSVTAGKWSSEEDQFKWQQSLRLGISKQLASGEGQHAHYGWGDTMEAAGIQYAVFGDDVVTNHRLMLQLRGPVLAPWVFWEIDPGLEWRRENGYGPNYRLFLGVDIVFSGK